MLFLKLLELGMIFEIALQNSRFRNISTTIKKMKAWNRKLRCSLKIRVLGSTDFCLCRWVRKWINPDKADLLSTAVPTLHTLFSTTRHWTTFKKLEIKSRKKTSLRYKYIGTIEQCLLFRRKSSKKNWTTNCQKWLETVKKLSKKIARNIFEIEYTFLKNINF